MQEMGVGSPSGAWRRDLLVGRIGLCHWRARKSRKIDGSRYVK
jgi:hypothetical protein